ncbi:MAG TPA: hypothetical protein VFS67_23600 [Polyangiaceae bacterium]|nr:hypothetical protein [Polyangiaceae bacterium]
MGLLIAGCLYDEDDRCGPNQHVASNDRRCVCDDGFVYSASGCVEGMQDSTGSGKACTSDADCEGQAASYCESFVSHSCLVPDCTVTPDNCHSGFECCSFAGIQGLESVPNLCLAEGLCQN